MILLQPNVGAPWFKEIPIPSFFTAEPTRTKTGLLLITLHVVHEQRETRAFIDDLCELPSAAWVPYQPTTLPPNGPTDRTVNMRRTLQLK